MGVSGSGKSTIAKLIARLYDVNQGVVRIDGIDVRDLRFERPPDKNLLHSCRKLCYLIEP